MLHPRLHSAAWFLGLIFASAALVAAGPDKQNEKGEKSARDEDGGGKAVAKKVDSKGGDAKKVAAEKGEAKAVDKSVDKAAVAKKAAGDEGEGKKVIVGAEKGGAEKGGAEKGGAEKGGAEKGGAEKGGAEKGGDGKDGKGGDLAGRVDALERQVRELASFVKRQAADGRKQPAKDAVGDAKPDKKKGEGKQDADEHQPQKKFAAADEKGHGKGAVKLIKGPDGQLLVPLSALPPGIQKQFLAEADDGEKKRDMKTTEPQEGEPNPRDRKTGEPKTGEPKKGEKDHHFPSAAKTGGEP